MQDRVFVLREKIVRITQILTGQGIRVTQEGVGAFVQGDADGRPVRVNLPYVGDNASEDLITAIEGFLDHEVAHVLFSDFKLLKESYARGKRVGEMHNLVEDPMIERLMSERFAGSAHNITKTQEFYLNHFVRPNLKELLAKGDAAGIAGLLIVSVVRALAGQRVFRDFLREPGVGELVKEQSARLEKYRARLEEMSTTKESQDLAIEITKSLEGEKKKPPCGGGEGKGGTADKDTKKENKGKTTKKSDESTPCAGDEGEPEEREEEDESAPGPDESSLGSKEKDGEESESKSPDEDEKEDESKPSGEDDEEGGATAPKSEKEETKGESKDADSSEKSESASGDEEGEGVVKGASSDEDEGEPSDETAGGGDHEADSDPAEGAGGAEHSSEHDVGAAAESEPDVFPDKIGERGDFDAAMGQVITGDALKAACTENYLPYTKDYDVIETLPLSPGQREALAPKLKKLDEDVLHHVGVMQKDLERAISARSKVIWQPGLRRGRLHSANLSRLAAGDDRVFRKRTEFSSKDVAVELVVDLSGSMGGHKVRVACEAAFALAQTLERIGIKNEVIGFTTMYRSTDVMDMRTVREDEEKLTAAGRSRPFSRYEAIYMPIFKGFDERLTYDVKARFVAGGDGHHVDMANNVDGECIEYAAHRLSKRREKGKVMIVLSDGAPSARGDHHALSDHLKKVVRSLPARGIKVVGLGIQTTTVRSFYPKHMIITNVDELPGVVMKELRNLLLD
jgi:cobalamin biosynthesis protein CobT